MPLPISSFLLFLTIMFVSEDNFFLNRCAVILKENYIEQENIRRIKGTGKVGTKKFK